MKYRGKRHLLSRILCASYGCFNSPLISRPHSSVLRFLPNLVVITGINCIKTQTFASVFRHHCPSPYIYRFGQKWFKVIIKNFRVTSLYECLSLIYKVLCIISWTIATQKKKGRKKNATENLTWHLTARVIKHVSVIMFFLRARLIQAPR